MGIIFCLLIARVITESTRPVHRIRPSQNGGPTGAQTADWVMKSLNTDGIIQANIHTGCIGEVLRSCGEWT